MIVFIRQQVHDWKNCLMNNYINKNVDYENMNNSLIHIVNKCQNKLGEVYGQKIDTL